MATQEPELGILFDLITGKGTERAGRQQFTEKIKEKPSLVTVTDDLGMTLLHLAAQHGRLTFCKILIACGADPYYSPSPHNKNAFDYAEMHQKGFSIHLHTILNDLEFNALYGLMISRGREEEEQNYIREFTQKIKEKPILLTITNDFGMTLLHLAARHGRINFCEILIAHGADPHHGAGPQNCNTFHYAEMHDPGFSIHIFRILDKFRRAAMARQQNLAVHFNFPIFSRKNKTTADSDTDSEDEILARDKENTGQRYTY